MNATTELLFLKDVVEPESEPAMEFEEEVEEE